MIFDIINKITYNKGIQISYMVFGIVLSPFMFIFQFFNNVFESNDFIHLVFICICVGMPIALIIASLTIIDQNVLDPKDKKKLAERRFSQIGTCCAITGFLFYLPCLYKYFDNSFSSRQAIKFLVIIYVGYISSSLISISRGTTKKVVDELEKLKSK